MTEHWRELLRRRDDCCDLLVRLKEAYDEQHAEIERLRARIAELETAAAITFGTLAQPTDDEPAIITHDIPPNAPR